MARDIACGAVGLALAALVWFAAGRIPRSLLSDEVGAAGFPRALAALLAVVSILVAIRGLRIRRDAGEEGGPPRTAHAKALGIVAIGFGAVLLGPIAGYVPTAFLLLAATAAYYGAAPRPRLAFVSVAGAVGLWLLFAKGLNVSMPAGLWARLFS